MYPHMAKIHLISVSYTHLDVYKRQPIYNAIVWVDNRAQSIADEWESSWLSAEAVSYTHLGVISAIVSS